MRRFGWAGLALAALVLVACSDDAISPSDKNTPGFPRPLAVPPEITSCSAADITTHITELMSVLTPNDNSALSKFETVQDLMAQNTPESIAEARAFLQNTLLKFIETKFLQATPDEQVQWIDEYEQLRAELLCFVGMFTIPTSNNPKAVVTPDGMMGVWFPEGFCDDECEGINVTLDELVACTAPGVPAGCTPAPLGTLLDIYGNFLRVTLSGDDPDWETPDAPIVGICAPAGTETLLQGLRIGHQDDGTSNTEGFTILDLVAIPSELDALLICDTYAANDAAPQTFFASVLTRVSNFLLPAKAVANPLMIGGLGIGGASRSFSPFGIINTTLGATGGSTGGLKSSFTPSHPDAPALATDADGNLADSADTQQLTSLPGVSVKTGLGTAIPGATVTFTMTTPVTLTPESEASVCDVNGATQTEIVVETDANGFAGLGCVNFGSVVGFKNLKATIDPSTADGVSDVDGIDQITVAACDPQCGVPEATTELNWKVETTPGNPASLSLDPALVTTAAAGAAFSPQPIVKVLDRNGNVVTGSNLTVTASATPPSGGAGGLVGTTTEQASSGVANFTGNGLGVGGTVGSWQLSFGSGALTPATANIDITAGTAFEILTYPGLAGLFTYTTGLTPGSAVSPAPRVIVRDAYQNPVNNVALLWSPPTGANGAVLNDAGGTSTGTDGTAQVTSWTLGDGLNEVFAYIAAQPEETRIPATFRATTPTGQPIFACTIGSSKQDLVPFSTKRPTNSGTKEVTLWMSVTGQSSYSAGYPATLEVFATSAAFQAGTGAIATKTGTVTLPGNNGNPTEVTFSFASSIPKGPGLLYFKLSITAPATRKFQLWYASSGFANNSDCANALMYPSYSALTPTIRGLRIRLTN